MNNEVWKDIYFIENGIEYNYIGLYQVSNLGRVKSLGNGLTYNSKERILKLNPHANVDKPHNQLYHLKFPCYLA